MKKMQWQLSAFLIMVTSVLYAQDFSKMGIPCSNFNGIFLPLEYSENENLEHRLSDKLNANPKWKKMIQQEKMAVSLVDLSDIYRVRSASINGDKMMYAASLPKIAILLAAMEALESGELLETSAIRADMKLMIAKSDNHASTRMIDRLGYEKIAAVLTNERYHLYDEKQGGGLWVGKRYAAGGKRYPDPLEGLSHAATTTQVARFYYLLAYGKLVSPERSEEMLQIMMNPKLHHKFVNTFEKIAPKAKLFRKSGSWSVYHSDSILVWGPQRQYILVALIEDANGEQIIRKIGKAVDEVMKGR